MKKTTNPCKRNVRSYKCTDGAYAAATKRAGLEGTTLAEAVEAFITRYGAAIATPGKKYPDRFAG